MVKGKHENALFEIMSFIAMNNFCMSVCVCVEGGGLVMVIIDTG